MCDQVGDSSLDVDIRLLDCVMWIRATVGIGRIRESEDRLARIRNKKKKTRPTTTYDKEEKTKIATEQRRVVERQKESDAQRKKERERHKKNEWDLPQLIGTVPVEADANVDGYDGEDDAEQDQRSSFTDGLDSDVDHNTHEGQQRRSVDPKIVVPHIGVDSWITKQGYLRCYVNLCVFIRLRAKSNQIKSNGSD